MTNLQFSLPGSVLQMVIQTQLVCYTHANTFLHKLKYIHNLLETAEQAEMQRFLYLHHILGLVDPINRIGIKRTQFTHKYYIKSHVLHNCN